MRTGSKFPKLILAVMLLAGIPMQVCLAQTPEDGTPQVHITQVDTSNFPQVMVYVSVTDAEGEPFGVEPSRLVLEENGVAIQTDHMMGQADVVEDITTLLVFDVSGSMNSYGKLTTAKAAARAYVEQMRPGDKVGLLTFNTAVTYVQPITTDSSALIEAIDRLRAEDDTAMYDALSEAVDILAEESGRTAIITLTDGMDNRSAFSLADVMQQIGPRGTTISTVGLGDPEQRDATTAGLDIPALQEVASESGGEYAYVNDEDRLTALYQRFARVLQSEYVLTYTSPSTLRDGLMRQLTIFLQEAETAGEDAVYNPGGLVPEVERPANWGVFLGVLALLIALLILPTVFERWGMRLLPARKRDKKAPRVRLMD
jgi:Ca-activated chloride channel family protein